MILGLAIKLTGTTMDLALPFLLAYVIDTAVPAASLPMIYFCGAAMGLCALVSITCNITANRMAARVSSLAVKALRHDLFEKITVLPLPVAEGFGIPSLISRLTTDTYHVHQLLDRMQRLGVRAPMLVLGGLILTFFLEPALASILLLLTPLLGLLVYRVSRRGIPLYASAQRAVEGLVRTVRENAAGVRVIRALGKGDYERERFQGVNRMAAEAEKKAGAVMAVTNPAMSLILNLGLMLVIIVGAFRVNAGLAQPGTIIAFLSYFTIILNAMLSVTKIFVLWSRGVASAGRIEAVLCAPMEPPLPPLERVEGRAYIDFSRVSFSYNGVRDNLSDVSFSIQKGETLGIVGGTGAGKTTLINLLLRFYPPSAGEICIGGERLSSIPKERLMGMFGTVFQNDALLSGSVADNIRFMRELPDADVRKAAEAAQAAEFIEALPGGYGYMLDIRGWNLSGGQRQRILIARALAGGPDILVLDDAESALDYRTCALLRADIRKSYPDVTLIVISERIGSVKNADRILVLDGGRAVGFGSHQQLLSACPIYRLMADVQMGGGEL